MENDFNNSACTIIEIPLWEPKWNRESLLAHLERVGVVAFNRGLRNVALSNKDRTFPSFEKCLDYNLKIADVYKKEFPIFCGVDLAPKKRKGTCIFTLAKDIKHKKFIPIDIRYGKWTGPKLVEEMEAIQKIYNPRSFLVENNALQDMVIDFIKAKNKNAGNKMMIKGFCTGSNKLDVNTGLPSLEVDFYNNDWIIPMGDRTHGVGCKCSFCAWKEEVIGHPLHEITDGLMASWFAKQNSKSSLIGRIRIL